MFLLPTLWPPHAPTHQLVYTPSPGNASSSNLPPSSIPLTPITPNFAPHLQPTHPHSAPPGPRHFNLPTNRASTSTPSSNSRPIDLTQQSTIPRPRLSLPIAVPPRSGISPSHSYLETLSERLFNDSGGPRLLPRFRPRDSLLGDRKYEMSMIQQPLQARMCNAGEKADRRPIDPPPIVQLKVIDTEGDAMGIENKSRKGKRAKRDVSKAGMNYMHNPYYFLYATLVGSDEPQTELHVTDDGKTRFLTGTPVSSLYYLKDMNHRDAAFFVFPDLGVRKEGQYKLKLTLFEIVDQEVFYCATSYTDTFTVLSAKKFPGMQRATELSKSFADQGLKIRVRKESKKRSSGLPARNKRRSSVTEDDYYYTKRPRQSLDSNYDPPMTAFDPAYPHAQASMPPPPIPQQPVRSIVHPPSAYDESHQQQVKQQYQQQLTQHYQQQQQEQQQYQYEQHRLSISGPPSAPLRRSLSYGESQIPLKRNAPPQGRSEGIPFSGHPAPPGPIPLPPPAQTATREKTYFQDERERQRHQDIQAAQRREIDSRRQAESARSANSTPSSRISQQQRQQVQQQHRLHQLALDQHAAQAQAQSHSPYQPGYGDRERYAAQSDSAHHAQPYRPSGAVQGSSFEDSRRSMSVKQEEGYSRGMTDERRASHDERRYQNQQAHSPYPQYPPSQHPQRAQQPSYLPQYPPAAATSGRPYDPRSHPSASRDRHASIDSVEPHRWRHQAESEREQNRPPAHSSSYPAPSLASGQSRLPPSQYAPHHSSTPTSSIDPRSQTPSHQQSSAPSFDSQRARSVSSNSGRSGSQPVRTPQQLHTLPLPSRAPINPGQMLTKLTPNHYEPPIRSMGRPDEWDTSTRGIEVDDRGRDRDSRNGRDGEQHGIRGVLLPPISKQGTPGTPMSTPGTSATPGRDHRLGLGHLVD